MALRIRRLIAGVSLALLVLQLTAAGAADDEVVATVNGQPISGTRLTDELLLRWGEFSLASLIQEMVIEQAAAEAGIELTEREVSRRALDVQRTIDMRAPMTGQSFTLWLADQKLSLYGFRQRLRIQILLEQMVAEEVQVTAVADLWERNKETMRRPEKMHVSHICVTTKEQAEQIRADIVGGKDFAEAAKEFSIDPWTKDQGGDFGWIPRGNDPFQTAVFALSKDGELSPVIETKMGWHVIRREEYRPAAVPTFGEVKEDLREKMMEGRRLQKMNEKRAQILEAAKVERKIDPADLVSTAEAAPGGTD
jgi:foldase protein PrsA